MASEYTPNTESVRAGLVALARSDAASRGDVDLEVVESEVVGQFDRWLAEVQAAAWIEGARSVSVETRKDPKATKYAMYGIQVRTRIPANPYRQEGGRGDESVNT